MRPETRPERRHTILPEQRRDVEIASIVRRLSTRGGRRPGMEADEHVARGTEDTLVARPAKAAGIAVVEAVEQRIGG